MQELIDRLAKLDYETLYRQWRFAHPGNWYLEGAPGKYLSERLDAFRRNLTEQERLEIEALVELDSPENQIRTMLRRRQN